eukprot:CAMPEP_0204639452 /NCGR_PEP_ID=MMETSP0717-20131115/42911_1 /ASSEMBLY_ACC=CAM_ASM_000666 /TAXON_ID=230516 /ORGANISM="Chaetoceros curvisetus" /LENGTH=194 /DNA_ID=CAMNT_0051659543 /DNA_START=204 /DNA_END=785 /DNA_ORIENTATION=+
MPPGRAKVLNLKFERDQIVKAQALQVDSDGEIVVGSEDSFDSYAIVLNQYGKDAALDDFEAQKTKIRRVMEEQMDMEEIADILDFDKFGSVAMTDPDLREKFAAQQKKAQGGRDDGKNEEEEKKASRRRYDLPNLDQLREFAVVEGDGQYLLPLRKYSIGHKKRRVTPLVNKINSYSRGSKNRLIVRENRNARW